MTDSCCRAFISSKKGKEKKGERGKGKEGYSEMERKRKERKRICQIEFILPN
jgi:hypothetical protein